MGLMGPGGSGTTIPDGSILVVTAGTYIGDGSLEVIFLAPEMQDVTHQTVSNGNLQTSVFDILQISYTSANTTWTATALKDLYLVQDDGQKTFVSSGSQAFKNGLKEFVFYRIIPA